ncbi:B12-binding domain-containing radical SAM protein [Thermodesulfobacteriota bacterium]
METESRREKVLLLNPPGKFPYTRDYFCSKVTKSLYLEPPLDLLILSGILKVDFHVEVIDAMVRGIGPETCRREIASGGFEAIISLTSSISWNEDAPFLRSIKEDQDLKIVAIGDALLREGILEELPWMDGILLDFTTPDIVRFLSGEIESIGNMIFRNNGALVTGSRTRKERTFSVPTPRHDLFIDERYGFPFQKKRPFTILLSDYGCPYSCPFCVNSRRSMGYKVRPIENVVAELRTIRALGVEELFFRDQTFGWDRERTTALCAEMNRFTPSFSWTCFSRVDVIREEILGAMSRAGCHTVIFGIESGDEEILRRFKPGVDLGIAKEAIALCRRFGIATVATFMMGFPGEGEESIRRTIHEARSLDPDFASFNMYTPKYGTSMGSRSLEGRATEAVMCLDQSGYLLPGIEDSPRLKEILALHRMAVRTFYLRPRYLFRSLTRIRSRHEFIHFLKNGSNLLSAAFHFRRTNPRGMIKDRPRRGRPC